MEYNNQNQKKFTLFKFTEFKIKHQKNGTHYLITPFICKRNIFLLNNEKLNKLKTNLTNKMCIYGDNYINVYVKNSKNGKKQKYFGNDKYIIIVEELDEDNSNDFLIDDDYESDGTILLSDSD